jgi:hypothetical protein
MPLDALQNEPHAPIAHGPVESVETEKRAATCLPYLRRCVAVNTKAATTRPLATLSEVVAVLSLTIACQSSEKVTHANRLAANR